MHSFVARFAAIKGCGIDAGVNVAWLVVHLYYPVKLHQGNIRGQHCG
jgi:hypothetical protein